MWYVCSQKNGASALGVQRVLGLGSYRTAWAWLHKLRRAMVRPGRDRLRGEVEVDESYVGGEEPGFRGPIESKKKALVAIAAEIRGRGIGRIRMRHVRDRLLESLMPFVEEAVEPGSLLVTDGWHPYAVLPQIGYRVKMNVLGRAYKQASSVLPRVHLVASLLKRWLLGTHQGAVSRHHLDYYLDEFTFRFNRRSSGDRGKLFMRLLENAVQVDPVPYKSLLRRPSRRPRLKKRLQSGRDHKR